MDTVSDIGKMLREARLEAGVSQASLARRAGTSQAAISRIERGLEAPGLGRLAVLFGCLGLRIEPELHPLAAHREEPLRLAEAGHLSAQQRLARAFGAGALTREIRTAVRTGG